MTEITAVKKTTNSKSKYIPYLCLGEIISSLAFFALWLHLLFLGVTLDSSGMLRLALRFMGVPMLPLKTNGSKGITHLLATVVLL